MGAREVSTQSYVGELLNNTNDNTEYSRLKGRKTRMVTGLFPLIKPQRRFFLEAVPLFSQK